MYDFDEGPGINDIGSSGYSSDFIEDSLLDLAPDSDDLMDELDNLETFRDELEDAASSIGIQGFGMALGLGEEIGLSERSPNKTSMDKTDEFIRDATEDIDRIPVSQMSEETDPRFDKEVLLGNKPDPEFKTNWRDIF